MKAEIYSTETCRYCVLAKNLLKRQDIEYFEYILGDNTSGKTLTETQLYVTKDKLLEKLPGASKVPQIWLDGNYIGGYTELSAFFANK